MLKKKRGKRDHLFAMDDVINYHVCACCLLSLRWQMLTSHLSLSIIIHQLVPKCCQRDPFYYSQTRHEELKENVGRHHSRSD